MNIVDQIKQKFPSSVKKVPLMVADPEFPRSIDTGMYGLYAYDYQSNEYVQCCPHSVSKKYRPHQLSDIIAMVESVSSVWGDVVLDKCRWRYGHHLSLTPSLEARVEIKKNDGIFPRIIIDAPYDGVFRASIGFYRDLCKNMAMMGSVQSTSVTIRHTARLDEHMQELIGKFSNLKLAWSSVLSACQEMENKKVSLRGVLESALGPRPVEEGRSLNSWVKKASKIQEIAARETYQLTGERLIRSEQLTGWIAFNAVQGYMQHHTRRQGQPTADARAFMALNDDVVRRAEAYILAA